MIKTTIIYFLVRGVNGLLALATMYCLTRMLTPTEYGIYALGVAAIGVFSSILFQWIAVTVSRFYAMHLKNPDVLISEAYRIFIQIATWAVLGTAIFVLWLPVKGLTPWLVIAIGGGAIAMGVHSLGLQIANARVEPIRYGMLTASRGALVLLGAVLLIEAGFGGNGAVFAAALASILAVAFFGIRRQGTANQKSGELRQQMISYGLPLTVTYFATMILDFSDRFIIGWRLGAPEVAGYAASYDLCQQTVGVALNVFFLVAYPKVTRAWEQGGAEAAHEAMLPLARSMILAIPLVMGVFIGLAKEISGIFFGEGIRENAAQVMPWITLGVGIAYFKGYFLDIVFQLNKSTRLQLKITVFMAVINVILNILLLPYFGIIGAAFSTLISFSCGAVVSWLLGRGLGIYPIYRRDIFFGVLVFIAMQLTLYFETISLSFTTHWASLIRGGLAVSTYLLISIVVNLGGSRSIIQNYLVARFRTD